MKTSIPGYGPIPVYANYVYIYIHAYITLHCIALHYITLHYHTLHYHTLHYHALHYHTLQYITIHACMQTSIHPSIHTYIERERDRPTYIIRYTYIYITHVSSGPRIQSQMFVIGWDTNTRIYAHTHTYIHAYTQMRVANGEPSF